MAKWIGLKLDGLTARLVSVVHWTLEDGKLIPRSLNWQVGNAGLMHVG